MAPASLSPSCSSSATTEMPRHPENLTATPGLQPHAASTMAEPGDAIAVVGMAMRLPGNVSSGKDFWNMLVEKRSGLCEVPPNRYSVEGFHDPSGTPGTLKMSQGYYLQDFDVPQFDTSFFSMSKKELEKLDPQQRQLLEVAYECMEDAGATDWRGSDIGCYVGVFGDDWQDLNAKETQHRGGYRVTGYDDFVLGNRVSYEFDLHGPSMTVKTGCSSSLVGLDMACQAIRKGDCAAALVCGTALIFSPGMALALNDQGVLSPSGICRTFDAAADGYGRGEGVNAVYIKDLRQALQDGDPIRAVIRGTSVNCDGRTPGMLMPSSTAQEALIRRTYSQAGLHDKMGETAFVECHGTGTAVGDPLETAAVAQCFGEQGVIITSVKPNVGHSEGAAGLTSLIKAILAIEHRLVPPNIYFDNPNPAIPFQRCKLHVPVDVERWPEGRAERVSVNSFGIGGVNAHVVVESYQQYISDEDSTAVLNNHEGNHHEIQSNGSLYPIGNGVHEATRSHENADSLHYMNGLNGTNGVNGVNGGSPATHGNEDPTVTSNGTVNGTTNGTVNGNANGHTNGNVNGNGIAHKNTERLEDAHHAHNGEVPNGNSNTSSNGNGLSNGGHKTTESGANESLLLFSAYSEDSLKDSIAAHRQYLEDKPSPLEDVAFTLANRRDHKPHRAYAVATPRGGLEASPSESAKPPASIGWVFTGQGAQWPEMGAQLIDTNPVFRDTITKLEAFLAGLPEPVPWSVEGELRKRTGESRVHNAEMGHPLSIAVQIGLIDVLRSWGLKPDFVVGHSSGEMAAAYASGSVTAEAAMAAATFRGTTSNDSEEPGKKGAMAAIGLGRHDVMPLLEPGVVIACENSQSSVTISGDAEGVQKMVQAVKEQHEGVLARLLRVEKAFHSHHMLKYGPLYEEHLQPFVRSSSPQVPFYSSVTGKRLSGDGCLGPAYWRQNMESPVLFNTAVRSALAGKEGRAVLIEIGPHPALKGPLGQVLRDLEREDVHVGTLDRNKTCTEALLHTAGKLFQQAAAFDLSAVCPPGGRPARDLPGYSWKRDSSHWKEPRVAREWRFRKDAPHELLGSRVVEVANERCWRNVASLEHLPWLSGHKVNGQIVFPAAGYVSMVGEALRQLAGDRTYTLKNVSMTSGLVLEHETSVELVTRLTPMAMDTDDSPWFSFCITSFDGTRWVKHCFGEARASTDKSFVPLGLAVEATETLARKVDDKEWYGILSRVGFQYTGAFEGLRDISVATQDNRSVGTVPNRDDQGARYSLHPGVIDRCFQLFTVSAYRGLGRNCRSIAVPTFLESVIIRPATQPLRTTANISSQDRGSFVGSLEARDGQGHAILQVKGFRATAVTSAGDEEKVPLITNIKWMPQVDMVRLGDYMHPRENCAKEWHLLEELTLLCVLDHQERVQVTGATPPHLVKFHSWMRDYIRDYKLGRNCFVSSEQRLWELSSDERLARIEKVRLEASASRYAVFCTAVHRLFSTAEDIFRGEVHPLHILLRDDVLTQIYTVGDELNYRDAIQLLAHTNPRLRILEVGAGTGGTTAKVLQALRSACNEGESMYSTYTYTDVSAGFMTAAKERFAGFDRMEYAALDINQDPIKQGFHPESYDLVIGSNVVHATPSLNTSLRHLRSLLRPGGRLFLQELCPDNKFVNYVMGFLPGWWLGADDDRVHEPYVTPERWTQELLAAGFNKPDALVLDGDAPYHQSVGIIASPAISFATSPRVTLMCHSADGPYVGEMRSALETSGIPTDTYLFGQGQPPPRQDIISLLDLQEPTAHGFSQEAFDTTVGCLTALGAKMIWVIPAAQVGCEDPRSAMTLGLARTARNELSAKIYTVELDSRTPVPEATRAVAEVLSRVYKPELDGDAMDPDWEYAVVNGQVLVPRFHWQPMLEAFSSSAGESEASLSKELTIRSPGLLHTMEWAQCPRQGPSEGQVVVETKAVGLNFRDVLIALGVLDNSTSELGLEACGIVTELGAGVEDVGIGDRVMFMSSGCFNTHVTVSADLCVKINNSMSFEQGAALPCVYATAAMALVDKAHLQAGQTILIHSACGGVGLAAIQIAQMIGAEIYCTVGNEEKIQHLILHHDIPRSHIFNSRDSTFLPAVMAATDNKGVDVVLNSLSGDLLYASWECVAEFGMMIEIGKRDFRRRAKLSMEAFEANRTFVGLDLWQVSQARPKQAAILLKQCMAWIRSGAIKPGALAGVHEAERIKEAFRVMQGGQHIGKIIVRMPEHPQTLEAAKVKPTLRLRPDRSYLLAGGLGGLGRAVATWMVESGARELVFLSRSGGRGAEAFADELRSQDCQVHMVAGSVALLADVQRAVQCAQRPVAGAINLSMVLKDVSLREMSFDDWQIATGPKVQGTWNLHHVLPQDLDFFILFSSYSGIVGQWGQANYAAANTFLDAFVQYRNRNGQAASVIDVGVMGELGFVWQNRDILELFRKSGMRILREEDLLDAMHLAMQRSKPAATPPPPALEAGGSSYTNPSQILLGLVTTVPIAGPSNRVVWKKDARAAVYHNMHRVAETSAKAGLEQNSIVGLLAAVADRPQVLEQEGTAAIVAKAVAQALANFLIKDEGTIHVEHSPEAVGVDSLVAMELRNWIRQQLGVEIGVMAIVQSASLLALGAAICAALAEQHVSE